MTRLTSSGGVIRPLLEPPRALVDEARVHTKPDGINITVKDPGTVAALDYHVPAEAFEEYAYDRAGPHGLVLRNFQKSLSYARKGRGNSDGDPVSIEFGEKSSTINIDRGGTDVSRTTKVFNVDPDSIRGEPNIPDREEHIDTHAVVDPSEFKDAILALSEYGSMVRVSADDGDLLLRVEGESADDGIRVEDAAEPTDGGGELGETYSTDYEVFFSMDYLNDMVKAAGEADMDHLSIRFGDEEPIYLKYEDTDTGATAEYILSPRIES